MSVSALVISLLVSAPWALAPAAAEALVQPVQLQRGIVIRDAPVYLRPDASLTPLRELSGGSSVTVNQVTDDWIQISFDDAQFGRRTGWIQRALVRLEAPEPQLQDAPADAPPARPAPSQPDPASTSPRRLGIRAFGTVAYDRMAAGKSFEALFDRRSLPAYGGGIQVTNLWRGLFAEVSAERSSVDGERAFVDDDGSVFPLGIPLEVTMTPLDVVAGWRFGPLRAVTPYAGAGYTSMAYTETSAFAEPDENVDERFNGWIVLGGAEFRLVAWLHVSGEFRYRHVPDALGEGGVSEAFDENRLGGFGGAFKIVFGR